MKKHLAASLVGIVFAGTSLASAAEQVEGNLQVSGGIAMPASATAVFSNPAGLVAAPTALELQAGAPEVWDHGTYRAGLQTGGSSYGAAAGMQLTDQSSSDPLYTYYGLAVGVPAFSLGIGGKTGVSNASGTTLNAGALFSVGSSAKVGLTARDIDHSVSEWGAGVAFEVTSGVHFVVDSAIDHNFKNPEIKPGLKVGNETAALTISYGTGAREEFADGFSAGGCYRFSGGNLLEIQYNAGGDLSKYFAALTVAL
jgi:hypothetical protein